MTEKHTKVLIIGSGPAGYTAGIYTARASLDPVIIAGTQVGGQLTATSEIENYPGFPESMGGSELMDRMREQAENMGTEIVYDTVVSVDFSGQPLSVKLDSGETYTADAVIIATGASPRWLDIPNEKELLGFGVSTCATCDGFFYRNKKVAVIGGGSAAVEEALYLANLASEVYLIHRRQQLRAEKVLQRRLFENPKVKTLWHKVAEEFIGDRDTGGLKAIRLKDTKGGPTEDLEVDGAFIAVGRSPNTEIFQQQVHLDKDGYVSTHNGTPLTSVRGVFVAGDVQDKIYQQVITAAASGCKAANEAERYLMELGLD